MMHSANELYKQLNAHLLELNKQIMSVINRTEANIAAGPYPDLQNIYSSTYSDGKPVLSELFAAKAQVLAGMAQLKAADTIAKAPRR